MNVAGQIFDVYDDSMLKVASANRDGLSGISVMDPVAVEALPDSKFALIMKTADRKIRKYPIADVDSVKLSGYYFTSVKNNLHPEIAKTAERGFLTKGAENTVDITNLHASDVVTHSWRGYPLHNEEHVKEAMAKFEYTASRMEPREKYAYAQAIINRAIDLNTMVDGDVLNYIHSDVNDNAVKIGCYIRSKSISDKSLLEDLNRISETPNPEAFVAFDKVAGLSKFVEEGKIPDGYATCYAFLKTAELEDERIKSIPLQTIEGLFDPAFAKEWAKDPVVVYKSLPDPTKAMIEKNAGAVSIAEKAIPATLAMLAIGSMARLKGANSVMDKQFEMKGWVKSKDGLYEKDGMRIVRKDGQYAVIDQDNAKKVCADSLDKLYLKV